MRNYIEATWNDADQYNYSGEQIGNRLRKSGRVHFNPDGSACVASYGDDEPKATKVPLKQRILPQASRVDKLRSEAIELEAAFKAGEFSAEEYTLLREVAFKKLRRAEELLKRAVTPVQREEETYEDTQQVGAEFAHSSVSNPSDNNGHGESYSSPVGGSFFAEVIDELSDDNSLKSFLKMSCKVVKKALQLSQAARNYYLTLKAL